MKLVVSYLIYPAFSLLLFYVITPDLSYVSPRVEALFFRSLFIVTVAYLYAFFLLLPTVIRFIVKRKGVRYGLEAFLYTASLIAVSLFLSRSCYSCRGKIYRRALLEIVGANMRKITTSAHMPTEIKVENVSENVAKIIAYPFETGYAAQ